MVVLSTTTKLLMFTAMRGFFKTFPHFFTPLNDLREVKEMLYMYESKQEFYPNTFQIGQSEYLLLGLYHLIKVVDLKYILFTLDLVLMLLRLLVVSQTNIKNKETAYLLVCFNPLSLFGQGLSNIGTFNDILFTLLISFVLKGYHLWYAVLAAFAAYFDPRLIFFVFPLQVFALRRANKQIELQLIGLLSLIISVWYLIVSPC